MSDPRFHVSPLPASGPVALSADDSRHATTVLRLKPGQTVELFDGRGNAAAAVISRASKSTVEVEISEMRSASRELSVPLELIVALPKGDRQKQLVDQLVQLGVAQLTPLDCERSVAQPTAGAIERLSRWVIETCKQCGRNTAMNIQTPATIAQLASQSDTTDAECFFAHPYGETAPLLASLSSSYQSRRKVRVIIGPEGGLTDAETQQLAQCGWKQVSLGARILRIETAAVMIAATWSALNLD